MRIYHWKARLILSEVEGSGPNLNAGRFFHALSGHGQPHVDRTGPPDFAGMTEMMIPPEPITV
jgi:hypothetical protein